ncbi:MAG: hypothetical protein GY737_12220 [Desulfobacteraceae bacterium]|nr:hypothetical protein [Desulfobacteraceae bacterium]
MKKVIYQTGKPEHLIFLDIDGVLRPATAYDGKLQKKAIAHVKVVAKALNSRIVITSTWRDIHSWEMFNRPDIFDGIVIGETPDIDHLHGENGRYHEVLAWLKQSDNEDVPWIALEDKPVHYPELPNVFLTNPETGIDQDVVDSILGNRDTKQESPTIGDILGAELHGKVRQYAAAREISLETALRQLVRAGTFLMKEG